MHMRPFLTLSHRVVWSCPWYQVRQDDIRLPDGRPGIYNTIEKPDAVWVIPVTTGNHLAMVYQYRYTVDDWCWEIPAGSVKPGQSIEEAVQDELREEVGGIAADLEYIGRFYPANGICSEVGHIFLATGVTLGHPQHEAAEVMQIHLKPIPIIIEMARTLQISDGPSALALLMCAEKLEALVSNQ